MTRAPRHAAVAILKGVYLRQPVVEPRRHQDGMVDVGLGHVLVVPVEEVVEFGVDVFPRAVLVDDTVGPGRVGPGRVGLLGSVLKAPAWRRVSNHWPN